MPRRGVALVLLVAAAGVAASVFAFRGGEHEPPGRPGAGTEAAQDSATIEAPSNRGTTEAEAEAKEEARAEPEAVVEPEAEAERAAPPAERSLLIGFVDDPSFRWRPYRARMLDAARSTGATVVRAMVYW